MRRGRELSKTVVTVVLILCAFVLAASLTGAGMTAIVSVLSSFLIFIFLPFFPRKSAALAVRRVHCGRTTRAPPLF
jgi:uncharacterized membrane protein YhaH (DUF805 family)